MKTNRVMTQEEKSLLLKDLCARLPYGVKVQVTQVPIGLSKDETLTYNRMYSLDESDEYITIKPYLRSIDDMTEEERHEYNTIAMHTIVTSKGFVHFEATDLIDWLNENHFDYREFIERGLAIAVTEENNPY